jgi:hypothetical protein
MPPEQTPPRAQPDARGKPRSGNAGTRIALALALLGTQAACTTLGVQPWERELLATPAMQLDSAPLLSGFDEHTYFSKEAASGGRGFGGGGCGCN